MAKDYLIGLTLWVLFVPSLIFGFIPFAILRLLHIFTAKIIRRDLTPIHRWQDNMFSVHSSSPTSHPCVNRLLVLELEGKCLNVEQIRTRIKQRLLSSRIKGRVRNLYSNIVPWGWYNWKTCVKEINIKDHVSERDDAFTSEEKLESFLGEWICTGFDERKPKWEVLLVSVQERERVKKFVLFKTHHNLFDGPSTITLVQLLLGDDEDSGIVRNAVKNILENDFGLVKKIGATILFPKLLVDSGLAQRRTWVANYQDVSNSNQVAWFMAWTTVDLKKFKKIVKNLGTSETAVLSSMLASALRRHWKEIGNVQIPPSCWITTPLPIRTEGQLGNFFSFNYCDVPMQTTSPIAKVHAAEHSLSSRNKGGFSYTWNSIFGPLFLLLQPLPLIRMGFKSSDKYNVLTQQHYLAKERFEGGRCGSIFGANVAHVYSIIQTSSIDEATYFNMTTTEYGEELGLCVCASNKVFKGQSDAKRFVEIYLKEEMDLLLD